MARIDVVSIIHAGWAAVLLPGLLKERAVNYHALLQRSYSIPPARPSEHIFLPRYSPVIFFPSCPHRLSPCFLLADRMERQFVLELGT